MRMNRAFPFAVKTLQVVTALALATSCIDAFATTATSNLGVTATVTAACNITTSPVAFGSYDPVSANHSSALTSSGSVTVTCTNGTSPNITLGQGANPSATSSDSQPQRQMASGSDMLAYSLYQDSGFATIWGNTSLTGSSFSSDGTAKVLTVYGIVPPNQNVPAGSYADTVTATVTF